MQDRLAAAAQKQQQNASKRFKTEKESTPAASSAYLQQKSELEAREGKDKGDDTSKWLVR